MARPESGATSVIWTHARRIAGRSASTTAAGQRHGVSREELCYREYQLLLLWRWISERSDADPRKPHLRGDWPRATSRFPSKRSITYHSPHVPRIFALRMRQLWTRPWSGPLVLQAPHASENLCRHRT